MITTYIWLFTSIILGAFGQISMKIGMNRAGEVPLDQGSGVLFQYALRTALSWPLLTAVFLYGTSFLLWLAVLSRQDLSLARPFTALGYFIVLAWGAYNGEAVTLSRGIGILLITAGVFFLLKK